ncbi:hypothetical protein CYB_1853 [Synechococcus sp. JA-2-3B'a(2-13)]|nr:hypothetical protein CYB_1853 [Synechococcus sp. JA-2-3B'a(2-13)]
MPWCCNLACDFVGAFPTTRQIPLAHLTPVPCAGQPLELILMDILPRHGDPQLTSDAAGKTLPRLRLRF